MANKKINISAEDRFDKFIEIAEHRGCGFEIQEFCNPPVMDGDWKSLLLHYQKRLENFPGDLALHNAYDGMMTDCADEKILAVIRERFDFNFMIARELGVKTIVSHFNWRSFFDGPWLAGWQVM